jgi:hypothetical protein
VIEQKMPIQERQPRREKKQGPAEGRSEETPDACQDSTPEVDRDRNSESLHLPVLGTCQAKTRRPAVVRVARFLRFSTAMGRSLGRTCRPRCFHGLRV